jgi:hypothetical protein
MADALRERGKTASASGDTTRGESIYTELAELAARIGDRWNGAIALNNIGDLALQSGDWERVVDFCGRSGELRRELGDEWGMALALCNVALAELKLGRISSAAKNLRLAVETSMKVDAKMVMAGCLEASAELALLRARIPEAARLMGAASRLQEDLGSVRNPNEQSWFEHVLESVRAALGSDVATGEIRRGWELSLDEAAGVALAVAANGD